MELLFAHGARVQAYDPVAMSETARLYPGEPALTLCERRDETLNDADGLIVVTEWNEFRSPNFDYVKQTLNEPVIFDGRNLYDPDYLGQLGFTHYAIGRGNRRGLLLAPDPPLSHLVTLPGVGREISAERLILYIYTVNLIDPCIKTQYS